MSKRRLKESTMIRERQRLEKLRCSLDYDTNKDVSNYCFGAVKMLDWILEGDAPPHNYADWLAGEKR